MLLVARQDSTETNPRGEVIHMPFHGDIAQAMSDPTAIGALSSSSTYMAALPDSVDAAIRRAVETITGDRKRRLHSRPAVRKTRNVGYAEPVHISP